jgi:hypothetical protein
VNEGDDGHQVVDANEGQNSIGEGAFGTIFAQHHLGGCRGGGCRYHGKKSCGQQRRARGDSSYRYEQGGESDFDCAYAQAPAPHFPKRSEADAAADGEDDQPHNEIMQGNERMQLLPGDEGGQPKTAKGGAGGKTDHQIPGHSRQADGGT